MNNVTLVGRLTRDIEVRYTQNSNTATCKFTLAVDRDRKKQETDFISCQAWGNTAEALGKWCRKGNRIAVSGSIRTGSYEDRNGNKVFTTDVNVDRMDILDFAGGEEKKPVEKQEQGFIPVDDIDDEELPF